MSFDFSTIAAAVGSGGIVGAVLGIVGGGGSILAVPLLVYVVGTKSPHVAIGTSAIAVSLSALGNVFGHWRAGNVKWRCAAVFATVGVAAAFGGAALAKAMNGQKLLALFGILMLVVGFSMLRKRKSSGNAGVHLSADNAATLLPWLVGIGAAVGFLSGFFGIGGGFLIVPGLMLATGMPLRMAIGTSLVAVAAFGAATAASYAASGMVDWTIAALFIGGGLAGGLAGVAIGRALANRKRALTVLFASLVIIVGAYVTYRGAITIAPGTFT